MRPTAAEELAAIGTMLTEVVAPVVADPYAATVLSAAVEALARTARQSAAAPALLAQEVAELESLLGLPQSQPGLPVADLVARHAELRGQLTGRIIALGGAADRVSIGESEAIIAHLTRAAKRWTP